MHHSWLLIACIALQGNRREARSILLRILQIGIAVGVTVGIAAYATRSLVPTVFTQDHVVSELVQRVMPVVALFMVCPLHSWC